MRLPIFVLGAVALATTSAAAVEYNELAEAVDVDAFADVDETWTKWAKTRIDACGAYGKNNTLRVDILVDRYRILADAVSVGDEEAAMSAASSLSAAINANGRFATCWKKIARKEGIPSSFARLIEDV